jgi:hypothetical protein
MNHVRHKSNISARADRSSRVTQCACGPSAVRFGRCCGPSAVPIPANIPESPRIPPSPAPSVFGTFRCYSRMFAVLEDNRGDWWGLALVLGFCRSVCGFVGGQRAARCLRAPTGLLSSGSRRRLLWTVPAAASGRASIRRSLSRSLPRGPRDRLDTTCAPLGSG